MPPTIAEFSLKSNPPFVSICAHQKHSHGAPQEGVARNTQRTCHDAQPLLIDRIQPVLRLILWLHRKDCLPQLAPWYTSCWSGGEVSVGPREFIPPHNSPPFPGAPTPLTEVGVLVGQDVLQTLLKQGNCSGILIKSNRIVGLLASGGGWQVKPEIQYTGCD